MRCFAYNQSLFEDASQIGLHLILSYRSEKRSVRSHLYITFFESGIYFKFYLFKTITNKTICGYLLVKFKVNGKLQHRLNIVCSAGHDLTVFIYQFNSKSYICATTVKMFYFFIKFSLFTKFENN
jgi:hypothetical protein